MHSRRVKTQPKEKKSAKVSLKFLDFIKEVVTNPNTQAQTLK